MKKTKTLSDTMYERIFEKLWTGNVEDNLDDEIMQEINLNILQEELMESEPIWGERDDEVYVTRLSVLNTVVEAILPGYRLVVTVDEDEETIGEVYLAEV